MTGIAGEHGGRGGRVESKMMEYIGERLQSMPVKGSWNLTES